jgi:hypothetical protein
MKRHTLFSMIACSALFLSGCAEYLEKKDLDVLTINMPREDVISRLKIAGMARGSIVNKFGQVIEVREYQLDNGRDAADVGVDVVLAICTLGITLPASLTAHGHIDTYWLYFCEGRLVQWGKAGDWDQTQKSVYEIRYR